MSLSVAWTFETYQVKFPFIGLLAHLFPRCGGWPEDGRKYMRVVEIILLPFKHLFNSLMEPLYTALSNL
jgi:hypothetical protein